jgi:hypothetical protein
MGICLGSFLSFEMIGSGQLFENPLSSDLHSSHPWLFMEIQISRQENIKENARMTRTQIFQFFGGKFEFPWTMLFSWKVKDD